MGQCLVSLIAPFDQYMASDLGCGAIASLGDANHVMAPFLSMGVLAIGWATLPVLSDVLVRGDIECAVSIAQKWSWRVFVFAAILSCVAWLLTPWGIKMLFQRGAFNASDPAAVVTLFRWAVPQQPFYCGMIVFTQLFASGRHFKVMAIVCVVSFIVKIFFDMLLSRFFGAIGLLLATDLMYVSAFGLYHVLAYGSKGARDEI